MNYFAHALPFLDNPYFAAGAGVPDMLMVADRGLKVRAKHARAFLRDADAITSAVAGGIHRHLFDDRVFHKTAVFAETSQSLTLAFRDAFGDRSSLRPRFLGHLMVELLLDAAIIAAVPQKLDKYYAVMESIDAELVQAAVNRMAPRPTGRLSPVINEICRERFLYDYLDNEKLAVRVNQILHRVGLDLLPECFQDLLPAARRMIALRKPALLEGTRAGKGDSRILP